MPPRPQAPHTPAGGGPGARVILYAALGTALVVTLWSAISALLTTLLLSYLLSVVARRISSLLGL